MEERNSVGTSPDKNTFCCHVEGAQASRRVVIKGATILSYLALIGLVYAVLLQSLGAGNKGDITPERFVEMLHLSLLPAFIIFLVLLILVRNIAPRPTCRCHTSPANEEDGILGTLVVYTIASALTIEYFIRNLPNHFLATPEDKLKSLACGALIAMLIFPILSIGSKFIRKHNNEVD